MAIPQNVMNMFGGQMAQAQAQAISPERQKWAMILAALGDAAGGLTGRPGVNNMAAVSHMAEQRNKGVKDVQDRQRLMEAVSGTLTPEAMSVLAAGGDFNMADKIGQRAQETKQIAAFRGDPNLPEALRGALANAPDGMVSQIAKDFYSNQFKPPTATRPGGVKQYVRNGKIALMTEQDALAAQAAGDDIKEYERPRAESGSEDTAAIRDAIAIGLERGTPEFADYIRTRTLPNSAAPPDPAAIESQAKLVAGYKAPPMSGYALRSPYGQAVMAKVAELNPEYDTQQWTASNKSYSNFRGTGRRATTINAFNTVSDHLGTLDTLFKAMDNGDAPTINRVKNMFQTQFGKAAPVSFEAAADLVGDEIVKAAVASGAGGGAVFDRKAISEKLKSSASPAQMMDVAKTYMDLIGGQLDTLRLEYENTTRRDDFDSLLSPNAKKFLVRTNPGAAPAAPAASSLKPGTIEDGHEYIGGDPSDQKSWRKVQ